MLGDDKQGAAQGARRTLLLLAGTSEARRLADRLAQLPQWHVVASLAGATENPLAYAVPMRRGGFGGAEGLRDWLGDNACDAVIDATHPFATRIGLAAAEACAVLGVPLLRLDRPAWQAEPGDQWIEVADAATAAATLPCGAVAFLASGPGALGPFAVRADLRIVLRVIDAPGEPLPPHVSTVVGRPPFRVEDEIAALRAAGATHLVCKNAGGTAGRAKLDAARTLGLPVVMIARAPRAQGVETVASVQAAVDWLTRQAV